MNAGVYIADVIIATISVDDEHYAAAQPVPTDGLCFFCTECRKIWAEIAIGSRKSQVITVPCKLHHVSPFWPGGSLYIPWAPWYHLEGEWLEYEFWRHVEIYEAHREAYA